MAGGPAMVGQISPVKIGKMRGSSLNRWIVSSAN